MPLPSAKRQKYCEFDAMHRSHRRAALTCHSEERSDVGISGRQLQFVQVTGKTCEPIASVAALTAQPLAALPPYGCGVPFTGGERLVQDNSTAEVLWCTTAQP